MTLTTVRPKNALIALITFKNVESSTVFALLMNVLFLVYEVLINKVTLLYVYKLEKRIKKLFK